MYLDKTIILPNHFFLRNHMKLTKRSKNEILDISQVSYS